MQNSASKQTRLLTICTVCAIVVAPAINCSPITRQNTTSKVAASNDGDNGNYLLGLYNMFGGGNPSATPDGLKIVEGDIAVPSADHESSPSQRKAIPDSSLYWPNGEVVYTYHESITPTEMSVIEAAMAHWRQHTCITFRQRQAHDFLFVRFRSDTQGCWSLVGRQMERYGQGQDVSIGQGCANMNVVVHEIGHVIGFYHEQSRSDRDQYIDIIWGNVLPGYALQFRKESDSNYNIPYDLTSTMQYPQWAFSKEIFEKSTIVARNPAYQRFLSKNYPLSFRDRMLANHLYSCTATCSAPGAGAGSCNNGGYLRATAGSMLTGGGCSCDCPPNFTGAACETQIRDDYYDTLPCGGSVTSEGQIQTPGYPQRVAPFQSCMWDIQAPPGKRVSIRFDGFEFAPRFTKPGTKVVNKCFNETVEIRLKNSNIYDGDNYCGSDLPPGTMLQSDGPRAVIIITANDKMFGRGLSARIRFLSDGQTGEDQEDDNPSTTSDNNQQTTTFKPQTAPPPATPPSIFTLATPPPPPPPPSPQPPVTIEPVVVQTLPPVMTPVPPSPPPPPPPPSIVVTSSSLLEEYERESKKTLPPVVPVGWL